MVDDEINQILPTLHESDNFVIALNIKDSYIIYFLSNNHHNPSKKDGEK